jgi:hypothetical protein
MNILGSWVTTLLAMEAVRTGHLPDNNVTSTGTGTVQGGAVYTIGAQVRLVGRLGI